VTVLDAVAALLVILGALGAVWAYKRSVASLESLGEAAAEIPPPLDAAARAEVHDKARPEVAELNALAARLEAGEKLSPAEHARVGMLVRDLEQLEQHRPIES
jgi:hypothetical protein